MSNTYLAIAEAQKTEIKVYSIDSLISNKEKSEQGIQPRMSLEFETHPMTIVMKSRKHELLTGTSKG